VYAGHRKAVSYVKFMSATDFVSASTDSSLKLWRTEAAEGSLELRGADLAHIFISLLFFLFKWSRDRTTLILYINKNNF
jgi:E3 ubiquitin-protein ligase RFWD2